MNEPAQAADQEPLPGLADGPMRAGGATELRRQVERSLRFMHANGLVDERHAGLMQLALELADTVRPGAKAYGIAQCAAQLLATFDKLMPTEEGGTGDGLRELQSYLEGVAASRRGA